MADKSARVSLQIDLKGNAPIGLRALASAVRELDSGVAKLASGFAATLGAIDTGIARTRINLAGLTAALREVAEARAQMHAARDAMQQRSFVHGGAAASQPRPGPAPVAQQHESAELTKATEALREAGRAATRFTEQLNAATVPAARQAAGDVGGPLSPERFADAIERGVERAMLRTGLLQAHFQAQQLGRVVADIRAPAGPAGHAQPGTLNALQAAESAVALLGRESAAAAMAIRQAASAAAALAQGLGRAPAPGVSAADELAPAASPRLPALPTQLRRLVPVAPMTQLAPRSGETHLPARVGTTQFHAGHPVTFIPHQGAQVQAAAQVEKASQKVASSLTALDGAIRTILDTVKARPAAGPATYSTSAGPFGAPRAPGTRGLTQFPPYDLAGDPVESRAPAPYSSRLTQIALAERRSAAKTHLAGERISDAGYYDPVDRPRGPKDRPRGPKAEGLEEKKEKQGKLKIDRLRGVWFRGRYYAPGEKMPEPRNLAGGGPLLPRFHDGGPVYLAGGGEGPALLKHDEHVINPDSARANRPLLNAINAARGPLTKAKKLYDFAEQRYGRKWALASLLGGQAVGWGATAAGAAMGMPLYIPGSTIAGMLPFLGMAELQRHAGPLAEKLGRAEAQARMRGAPERFWRFAHGGPVEGDTLRRPSRRLARGLGSISEQFNQWLAQWRARKAAQSAGGAQLGAFADKLFHGEETTGSRYLVPGAGWVMDNLNPYGWANPAELRRRMNIFDLFAKGPGIFLRRAGESLHARARAYLNPPRVEDSPHMKEFNYSSWAFRKILGELSGADPDTVLAGSLDARTMKQAWIKDEEAFFTKLQHATRHMDRATMYAPSEETMEAIRGKKQELYKLVTDINEFSVRRSHPAPATPQEVVPEPQIVPGHYGRRGAPNFNLRQAKELLEQGYNAKTVLEELRGRTGLADDTIKGIISDARKQLGMKGRARYKAEGGAIGYLDDGGPVRGSDGAELRSQPWARPRGTDTVPAMLTIDEFVVNRDSARANRGLLDRINQARGPVYLAKGGLLGRLGGMLRRRPRRQEEEILPSWDIDDEDEGAKRLLDDPRAMAEAQDDFREGDEVATVYGKARRKGHRGRSMHGMLRRMGRMQHQRSGATTARTPEPDRAQAMPPTPPAAKDTIATPAPRATTAPPATAPSARTATTAVYNPPAPAGPAPAPPQRQGAGAPPGPPGRQPPGRPPQGPTPQGPTSNMLAGTILVRVMNWDEGAAKFRGAGGAAGGGGAGAGAGRQKKEPGFDLMKLAAPVYLAQQAAALPTAALESLTNYSRALNDTTQSQYAYDRAIQESIPIIGSAVAAWNQFRDATLNPGLVQRQIQGRDQAQLHDRAMAGLAVRGQMEPRLDSARFEGAQGRIQADAAAAFARAPLPAMATARTSLAEQIRYREEQQLQPHREALARAESQLGAARQVAGVASGDMAASDARLRGLNAQRDENRGTLDRHLRAQGQVINASGIMRRDPNITPEVLDRDNPARTNVLARQQRREEAERERELGSGGMVAGVASTLWGNFNRGLGILRRDGVASAAATLVTGGSSPEARSLENRAPEVSQTLRERQQLEAQINNELGRREEAINRERGALQNVARAESAVRQASIALMRQQLQIEEQRENRMRSTAQAVGAMRPQQRRIAFRALEHLQRNVEQHGAAAGLDRTLPGVIERARRIDPALVANLQEQAGNAAIERQRQRGGALPEEFRNRTLQQQEGEVNRLRPQVDINVRVDEARVSEDFARVLGRIIDRLDDLVTRRIQEAENRTMTGQWQQQGGG